MCCSKSGELNSLGGLKPCMDAMRTLKKRQTRGEAIIRRHDGSLKVETVKAGVLRSDTELCGTDKAQVVVSSGLRTLIHMGLEAVGKAATRDSGFDSYRLHQ